MTRVLRLSFIALLIGVPLLCYAFLDQLYVRRFADFGHKWLAREAYHLRTRDQPISDILKRYEEVVLASDDLKSFGIAANEELGRFSTSPVVVKRVGFFEYQTLIRTDLPQARVIYFDFRDDTSLFDLLIFILAILICIGFAIFSRARLARLREETIEKTTIRTIQGIAHDFRAPFGKLRIFMSQLQQTKELQKSRESLDVAIDHADDILTDFLSLETKSDAHPFECQKLLKRLETRYFQSQGSEYPHVTLRFDCSSVEWVLGNERKSLRILFNLIDNALKHAQSQVVVAVKKEFGSVKISVTNDGDTIASDQLKSIFKPFYSKRKGGLGLGLFICESFVRAQGSQLICTSNQGLTTFQFSLPAAQEPMESSAKRVAPDADFHIAYVDDEAFYRQSLESAMESSRVRIHSFEDTDSLLLALKAGETRFDLILVDRYGPTFDAVEDQFAASCRDYGHKGPIALYSNSVTSDTIVNGFDKVIDKTKPLHPDDIIKIIGETK